MAVSKRVRFDVFKRDDFTCQYCGRRTPDVVLEVDHIIPRAEGGGDEPENLLTACVDCNRGKGAIPLDTKAAAERMAERTQEIQDREEQLRAYHAAQAERRARQQAQLLPIIERWDDSFSYGYRTPQNTVLLRFIERLGPEEVEDAIDITSAKFRSATDDAVRYFVGVCKRKVAELEGRVVSCYVCGRRIVLDPGEDIAARWRHGDCEPADG